jgi:hypothetical protein
VLDIAGIEQGIDGRGIEAIEHLGVHALDQTHIGCFSFGSHGALGNSLPFGPGRDWSAGVSHKPYRLVLVATLWLASTAHADALRERIQACAANRDDAARLHCFDELAAAMPAEKPAPPPLPPPMARQSPPPPETVTARIVAVSQPNGRNYRIELDNQEVWLESEHVRDVELEPGQTVRIKPGVLGSFFLILESGRSTRVRRIR